MHSSSESVSAVLQRLGQNYSDQDWEVLMALMEDDVRSVCLRMCGDAFFADDAMQDTWMKIRNKASQFQLADQDPEPKARGWVRKVAATTTLSLMRSRKRAAARERRYAGSDEDHSDPLQEITRRDLAAQVRSVLSELPEREQTAVSLRHLAGLSFEDVAEAMDCPIGSAKTWVRRSLSKMRRNLKRRGVGISTVFLISFLQTIDAAEGGAAAAQVVTECSLVPLGTSAFLGGTVIMSSACLAVIAALSVLFVTTDTEDPFMKKLRELGIEIPEGFSGGTIDVTFGEPGVPVTVTIKEERPQDESIHTQVYTGPAIKGNKIAWSAAEGGFYTPFTSITPVMNDDVIIFTGSEKLGVYDVHGTLLWSMKRDAYQQRPAVAGDIVYVFDQCLVTALRLKDGTQLWQRKFVPADERSGEDVQEINADALIDGGMVLVPGRSGFIHAIDAMDGRDIWVYRCPQKSEYMQLAVRDGVIYAVDWGEALEAHDSATGKLLWRSEVEGLSSNAPSLYDEHIYLARSAKNPDDLEEGFILCLMRDSGALVWEQQLQQDFKAIGAPVVTQEVVVTTGGKHVHALDKHDGRALWSRPRAQFGAESLIVDVAGRVLMGGENEMRLLEGRTGKEVLHINLLDYYSQEEIKQLPHGKFTREGEEERLDFGDLAVPLPVKDRLYVTTSSGWFGAVDAPGVLPPAGQGNTLPFADN